MEIKECKSYNLIIKEIETLLLNIVDEVKSSFNPQILKVNSKYLGSQKEISFVKTENTTLFGIIVHKYEYYETIVSVSFSNRELKIEIKNPSEFLNFVLREKFTEFAIKNEDSIKSLCFINDF